MSRLSDDEKRVFSDQISLLKNENERLTKINTDLEIEITNDNMELLDSVIKNEKLKEENTLLAEHNQGLRKQVVEYAAMKSYLRSGPDGSDKPMWHDVSEEEREQHRQLAKDVILAGGDDG